MPLSEQGGDMPGEEAGSSDVKASQTGEGEVRRRSAWREFCSSTAIHGLRYLAQRDLNKFEKGFWVAALLLSLAGSGALMRRMYGRWETTPVVGTNEILMRPVWELPFPAVTVCSQNKWGSGPGNASDADLGAHERESLDLGLQRVQSLLCENPASCIHDATVPQSDIDFLISVAPKWESVFRGFMWRRRGIYSNVAELREGYEFWTPILTQEGLCYTHNILQSSELFTKNAVQYSPPLRDNETRFPARGWSPSRGYDVGEVAEAVDSTYPARALPGAQNGLAVLLCAAIRDMDYNCNGPVQGFKVVLHHPAEMPHMRHHTRSILGEELHMIIEPSAISFSDELRGYEPSERACFFPEERRLRYFQMYTRKNCEMECSSNFTQKLCGCVPFYMPRSSDIPICGPGKSECLLRAEEKMVLEEIRGEGLRKAGLPSGLGCHCLPACSSIEYDSDAQLVDFGFEMSIKAWRASYPEFSGADCARLVVHFNDRAVVVGHQRNELYSSAKLIAACAAVLGLFTGFSLINVIEAVFFLSLGPVVRVFKKYGPWQLALTRVNSS